MAENDDVRGDGADRTDLLPAEDAEDAHGLFRTLGRQIKILRERAGLSRRELADRLGYSEATVNSVERGRRVPQPEFLVAVDKFFDVGGLLATAAEDVEKAKVRARVRHPAWFRDYARLEREAVELCYYVNHVMPGIFQTEEHARALFEMRKPLLDAETIEQRVEARLSRQAILAKWPAPMVVCVIEEVVLRRPIGGWEIHRRQLEALLRIGRMRNVELQVMPSDRAEHAGVGGPLTLLTPKGRPQVAYLEVQSESILITDAEEVRILASRFGSIRGQALTPVESLAVIEKLVGER
ncbi:helix-turn-helix domain-containing protein [Yinghuangia soli]|uniref:Helix-turn-helix transcriptional regulator n=1 Tax=Yinghuangia soli TaxID=2908204 RepID=A0AA41PUB5_9ACTN|nr:helix-turn-helix transcriptional regulator [Yinghuangia soli]MCF2525873.1 helix-turn-helix transcriptional regulator [Yinghuangia soli]